MPLSVTGPHVVALASRLPSDPGGRIILRSRGWSADFPHNNPTFS